MITSNTLQIVPVDVEQLDWVIPLFCEYRQFYGMDSHLPAVRDFLFDRLTRNEALIFVALEENSPNTPQAVGFMLLYPTFSSLALGPIFLLNDLYVRPEARRQGIANRLVDTAKNLAREFDYRRIILETQVNNDPARQLYESLEFVKEEQFERYSLDVDS